MTTKTLDRLVELWPHLSEAARADLITRAEATATLADKIEFTSEDLAGIERGRQDFRDGRTLSLPECRAAMDTFFDRLKARATTTT